jgi:predicted MFS family arabinose efflux permease
MNDRSSGRLVPSRSAVRRIALATGLSGTGSGIAGVALSYLVFERTNSAVWLAGTLFFSFGVVGLLTPLAGKLVDQYDRRRVMIVSDLSSLATWSLLAFTREPLAIAAIGFVASVLAVPVRLAANAAVPNLVKEDDLPWANGLIAAAANAARLVGPAFGGGLYALGGATLAFIVNAASFGASALLVASVRGRSFSAERTGEEPSASSLEGFRVIRRDRMLLSITIAWTLMWLAMNVAYVADPPLARGFGVGPLGFGLIDTSFGAGALLGSVLATRLVRSSERAWIAAGMLGVGAGWAMIALTPLFALVLVGSALAAGLDAIGSVAGYGLIQRRTRDAVRGRVFAAQSAAGLSANMIGFIVVGPLVEALGPQAVYGVGGIVSVVAALTFVIPTRRSAIVVEGTTTRTV